MKKLFFIAIAFLAMTSCAKQQEGTTTSQEDVESKEELVIEANPGVSAIKVAIDLAKYGYETESASSLIEAANILASVQTQTLEAEVKIEEGKESAEKVERNCREPKALLEAAKEFAGEDEVLLAQIAKVEEKLAMLADSEATRGAVGGPKYAESHVNAYSYTYYTAKFWADETAEIAVIGDGDTDLDLYIYDSNGNLIARDADYTDDCYVRWVPRWTGSFSIKIVNRGSVYNNFVIVTN